MGMSQDNAAAKRRETFEQALHMLEDLQFLRDVVASANATPGEVRRLSGVLRRLLVNRDLPRLAQPRTGRVELHATDTRGFVKLNEKSPLHFFADGGRVNLLGMTHGVILRNRGRMRHADLQPLLEQVRDDMQNERFIALKVDGFLKQKVLCFQGEWVSRGALIEYVANKGGGVHSDTPQTETERLIKRVRTVVRVVGMGVAMNDEPFETEEPPLICDDGIDCVLLLVFSAASLLVNSPDVIALEQVISSEWAELHPNMVRGTFPDVLRANS